LNSEAQGYLVVNSFLEVLTVLATLGLALWFLGRLLRPKAPAEPAEDPFSRVSAPRMVGPKGKHGAVALEEPQDGDPADLFPPRAL
jgi:hypothetical protein